MVSAVTKHDQTSEKGTPPENSARELSVPEKRFPRSAVSYIDALLGIQRQRFEKELTFQLPDCGHKETHFQVLKNRVTVPNALDILAESDGFTGTGWSDLGRRRKGDAFRWMGRMACLLLPVDLEAGADIRIEGCGFSRRKYIHDLTVWLDDMPLTGKIARRGLNRWTFTGIIPAQTWRPYSILRLQTSGQSRLAVGVDTYVSLAVSRIAIKPNTPPGS